VDNYPDLSPAARGALSGYGERLAEGAERMGLVSRGDIPRLYRRHLREALAPELIRLLPQGVRVVDVGSGGGLPGIPVAIVRPDLEITLVESRRRKAGFLERTVLEMGLTQVRVIGLTLKEVVTVEPSPWTIAISRGFAWTRPLVAVLEEMMEVDGVLLRYGALEPGLEGVEVYPIPGEDPRGIQRWPRSTWEGLPGTK
jgi:16S rRNA (guanine527-N7)-methyltransferase